MREFGYARPAHAADALALAARPGARFLGGGTNLVDLMKLGVETPELLVFNQIDRLEPEAAQSIAARHGGVAVSALRRHGLTELVARADAMLRETLAERPPAPALAQGG